MPENTKSIKKDFDGRPSPQYFNPDADDYEYLHGRNGASFAELLGPDGNPISTMNRLPVEAEATLTGSVVDEVNDAVRVASVGRNVTTEILISDPGVELASGASHLTGTVMTDCDAISVGLRMSDPSNAPVTVEVFPRASGGAVSSPPFAVVLIDEEPTANFRAVTDRHRQKTAAVFIRVTNDHTSTRTLRDLEINRFFLSRETEQEEE